MQEHSFTIDYWSERDRKIAHEIVEEIAQEKQSQIDERRRRESLSCTVKARLVGGCLVITLPSEIKRAAQIEVGDSVSLAMDESGKIRVERVREGVEVGR